MMNILTILASLYIASNGVVIKPDTVNQTPYISVDITADPRGFNGVEDNEWNLVQRIGNTLNDWGLILTLEAEEYAFNRDSSVTISICGRSESPSPNFQMDPFFAISFGDEQYFTFATDLDTGLIVTPTSDVGTFIYPVCGSNSIIQGSPVGLIPDDGSGTLNVWEFRDAFADGDAENFDKITSTVNGENFPLKFEFINDQDQDTLTVKYSTPTFTTPLECTFNTAIPDGKDLKMYLVPDVQDENLVIESFTINQDTTCADTTTTPSPTTPSPTECESTTAYEYVGTAASVDDAEDLCEAVGSTLAIVKDSDDLEIYRQAWEDEGLPYCGVWDCDGQSAIGLYDRDTEGTFTWSDGTAYGSVPNFGVGEPNDLFGEDCVTMSFTSNTDGTLTYANDIGCEYEFSNELYVFCNQDPCNPFTPSPTECNGGYQYVGQADSVNDARTLCEDIGSTLATVNSDADVNIYRQALDDEGIAQTGSWNGLGQTAIGLGDSDNEGVYVWDDGTECKLNSNLCYDYWGGGEPNDSGGEDCVTFSFPSDSTTYSNDIDCDYSFPNKLYVFCNVECDGDCDKFIYVDTPMSFEDAAAYCYSEYGTSLAGVNEVDIPEANCVITDPGEPTWVGLYSETDPAFFEFVSGEECDIPFSGACVDFWGTFNKGERAPKCLKEGGYQCGYYRESSELVYNNLDCETEAPFLCEKYPVSSSAHIGLFNEIKDYIDEGINGNNGNGENKFYMTTITTIAGLILIITLIIECIYCLCKSKNKNEKVSYDKLGSEIEIECGEDGVVKQDI